MTPHWARITALLVGGHLLACGDAPSTKTDTAPSADDTAAPSTPPKGLVLNELMPVNDSTVMDDVGDFPDWLELYNGGKEPIARSRITLQDTSEATWTGGDGSIAPGERLLLWADDTEDASDRLPFQISGGGETVDLLIDGVIVDSVTTDAMEGDVTWARHPDGGEWAPSINATPGTTNPDAPSESTDPRSVFFQREEVLEYRLYVPEKDLETLDLDLMPEVMGSLEFEGIRFEQVGIRLKGGASYRHLEGKPAFKVDLNEYVSGQRLRGLKGLTFNNANQDPTTTHEYITYGLFRAAGVPAARIGFANVWLNDELYGLYVHFEDFDDLFLEQWFDRPEEVHLWEGSRNDWTAVGSPTNYEYEEGPGETEGLMDEISGDFFVDPLDETAMDTWSAGVDMDAFLAMNAMDALTINTGGYQHVHNFYVYRTADALWGWTSTGADYSWHNDYYGAYGGEGNHFNLFLQNPEWEAAYNQALRDAVDLAENSDLPGLFDALIEFLEPHFTADPRKEHTIADIVEAREETRNYLETRPTELLEIVAAHKKK